MRRFFPLLLVIPLLLVLVSAASGVPARGPYVVSHCDWHTGSGCPPVKPSCTLRKGGAQDPSCTPGALNPAVRQQTIGTTICRSGWTSLIRPPTSYTDPLKNESMAAYGLGENTQFFEYDHLISLELGGAPSDPRNLWPESHYGPSFSYRKDGLENSLNAKVCDGALTLAVAQRRIVNWTHYVSSGGSLAPKPEPPAPPPPTPPPHSNCDPSYPTVCIAPPPPDLDCSQIPYRNFKVIPPDDQGFDGNHNGIGCET